MINILNSIATKPAYSVNLQGNVKPTLPKLGNDTFCRTSNVAFGASFRENERDLIDSEIETIQPQMVTNHVIASNLERSAGAIERAEPFYMKNFLLIDSVVKSHKNIEYGDLFHNYAQSALCAVSNIHSQSMVDYLENGEEQTEKSEELRERGKNLIRRFINTAEARFAPSAIDHEQINQLKTVLDNPKGVLQRPDAFGGSVVESTKEQRKAYAHIISPVDIVEHFASVDVLKDEITRQKAKINAQMPDVKFSFAEHQEYANNLEERALVAHLYHIPNANLMDRYKMLNNQLISHHINEKATDKASDVLTETADFLHQKDPYHLYWQSEDFDFSLARILETSKGVAPVDAKALDGAIELMQKNKGSVSKQMESLEKIKTEPHILRGVTFFLFDDPKDKNHNILANYSVHLLDENRTPESTRQLKVIAKVHPIEAVRKFATTQLIKHSWL